VDLGLKGRTALVTGASSGLGRAIAIALGAEGARVAVAARRVDRLAEVAAEVDAAGGEGLAVPWDLADRSVIDGNVGLIEARFGGIDILVNNTGGPPPTPAAGQDPALWLRQFEAMVLCVIALTDRVLPGMRARRFGRVITSTSSGVEQPIPGLAISNALRLSLVGWSKTLSREVGREGVTVNIVLPGRIETDRLLFLDRTTAERQGRTAESVAAEQAASIPLGRYGRPEEYGAVVAFLASTRASYITGSIVRVDGGIIQGL